MALSDMNDRELLNQIEHISDIFTKMVLKTAAADLAGDASEEITVPQFQALKHIALHGQCTVGQLAQGLSISQPAATMLVDRMAKRGLVDRQPGSSDRRRADVSLTQRAVALLERIDNERADRLGRTLSLMKETERRQFAQSMELFVSAALKLEQSVEEACLRCGSDHQADCIVNKARRQLSGKDIINI